MDDGSPFTCTNIDAIFDTGLSGRFGYDSPLFEEHDLQLQSLKLQLLNLFRDDAGKNEVKFATVIFT